MQEPDSMVDTAPVIHWLAPGLQNGRRVVASQIIGLGGIIGFCFFCCAIAGMVVFVASDPDRGQELSDVIVTATIMLVAAGCYTTTLFTLHTIASSLLPLSFRLFLVFAVIYGCLRLSTWFSEVPVGVVHVIGLMPFCIGGFFQRWMRRWRCLAWNQIPRTSQLTISGLMDMTTTAALSLAVLTVAIQWSEVEIEQLLLFIGSVPVFAVIGMHCWIRLYALCPISSQAESGYGIWLAINLSIAFFSFAAFLVIYSQSAYGLGAFIIAPTTVLIAHVATEIPIRWLRGCGWTFERISKTIDR